MLSLDRQAAVLRDAGGQLCGHLSKGRKGVGVPLAHAAKLNLVGHSVFMYVSVCLYK